MDREVIDPSVVRVVLLYGPRCDQYDSQGKHCLIKVLYLITYMDRKENMEFMSDSLDMHKCTFTQLTLNKYKP